MSKSCNKESSSCQSRIVPKVNIKCTFYQFSAPESIKTRAFKYGVSVDPSNGMHLNHDFYVVVGKQCRTENA